MNRDFELEAQTGLIGDLVWHDLDGDGLQDGGEPGLVGIVVNLLDSGGGFVISTTTDANGIYTFTAPPGDYIVEFEPPTGYEITLQDEGGDDSVDSDADPVTGRTGVITLTASAVIDDVDAGLYQPVTIGDFIFLDPNANGIQDPGETNGVPGVPITLTNLATGALYNTISDGSGAYTFTVPPGSYAVSMPAALSGLVRTSPSPATATLSSGQSDLTLDFGYISPTAVMLASFSAETTAGGVILRWSTSAERDQEGFIVWRAVGETGPYQAVSELILATNAPDAPVIPGSTPTPAPARSGTSCKACPMASSSGRSRRVKTQDRAAATARSCRSSPVSPPASSLHPSTHPRRRTPGGDVHSAHLPGPWERAPVAGARPGQNDARPPYHCAPPRPGRVPTITTNSRARVTAVYSKLRCNIT